MHHLHLKVGKPLPDAAEDGPDQLGRVALCILRPRHATLSPLDDSMGMLPQTVLAMKGSVHSGHVGHEACGLLVRVTVDLGTQAEPALVEVALEDSIQGQHFHQALPHMPAGLAEHTWLQADCRSAQHIPMQEVYSEPDSDTIFSHQHFTTTLKHASLASQNVFERPGHD